MRKKIFERILIGTGNTHCMNEKRPLQKAALPMVDILITNGTKLVMLHLATGTRAGNGGDSVGRGGIT
jgi:hypothetical protein